MPITDAAEQAAVNSKLREGRKVVARAQGRTAPKKAMASKVEELYKQLPAHARLELMTRLAAELASDEQRKLVEQLLFQLPTEALQQLEEWLRRRNGVR